MSQAQVVTGCRAVVSNYSYLPQRIVLNINTLSTMAFPHTESTHLEPDVKTLTREWLAEEETIALKRLLDVRSRMNMMAPACRLPAELLVEIFKTVQKFSPTDGMRWIRVTHVCRYWRDIALHSQALWACIRPCSGSFVRMCKKRAGVAPLSLFWDSSISSPEMNLVLPFKDRFVKVFLALSPDDMLENIGDFDEPWHNLESLTLSTTALSPEIDLLDLSCWTSSARLQNLRLDAVAFPIACWSTLAIFRALRSLSLLNWPHDVQPSMADVLGVLESCASLQVLLLDRVEPAPLDVDVASYPNPTRKVSLPGLQKLTLSFGRGLDIAHFLAHLDLSSRTHVTLNKYHPTHIPRLTEPGVAYCLPCDRSSFAYLGGMASVFVLQHRVYTEVTASHKNHDDEDEVPCFSINTWGRNPELAAKNILRQLRFLFEGHCTPKTVTFRFRLRDLDDGEVTVQDWQEAFVPFASATRIVLKQERGWDLDDPEDYPGYTNALRRFLEALAPPSTPSAKQLVPHLQTLHFRRFEQPLLDGIEEDVARCITSRGAQFLLE